MLERVKAIEIMLMNREEELQRRDLEAWKSQKVGTRGGSEG